MKGLLQIRDEQHHPNFTGERLLVCIKFGNCNIL
jgi:hypothetical protein